MANNEKEININDIDSKIKPHDKIEIMGPDIKRNPHLDGTIFKPFPDINKDPLQDIGLTFDPNERINKTTGELECKAWAIPEEWYKSEKRLSKREFKLWLKAVKLVKEELARRNARWNGHADEIRFNPWAVIHSNRLPYYTKKEIQKMIENKIKKLKSDKAIKNLSNKPDWDKFVELVNNIFDKNKKIDLTKVFNDIKKGVTEDINLFEILMPDSKGKPEHVIQKENKYLEKHGVNMKIGDTFEFIKNGKKSKYTLTGLDYDFITDKVVIHAERSDILGTKTECTFKLETIKDISKDMKVEKEQLEKAPEFKNFKPLKKW